MNVTACPTSGRAFDIVNAGVGGYAGAVAVSFRELQAARRLRRRLGLGRRERRDERAPFGQSM